MPDAHRMEIDALLLRCGRAAIAVDHAARG